MFAPAVKVEPVVGCVRLTVGAAFAPVQLTPLMAKFVGAVLTPVKVPLNPIWVVPFVPRLPLYDMLVAVTFGLPCGWLQLAFQPCDTRWVPGKANVRDQLVIGSPRLCRVRLAEKPPPPPQSVAA